MIPNKGKVGFIDEVHPILIEILEQHGFVCEQLFHLSKEEIMTLLPDFQGFVLRSKFKITKEIIDKCPQLRFIARSGSGLENIDVQYASEKGIYCFNSPEGNRDAVAEQTLGMLLCLFNNINTAHIQVKNGLWDRESNRGIELKGKTIGLIGYGVMGRAVAQRLSGFDVKILAHDKFKQRYSDNYAKESSMLDLYNECDIISLHVNYLPENKYLINKEFIESFKKSIFVINTARGNCLNTKDLLDQLKKGKVLGACLDVLEYESISFEEHNYENETLKELLSLENVIVTPHIAGWTKESYVKLSTVLGDKIRSVF